MNWYDWAIILFLVFLAYLFFSDKKEAIDKNKKRGLQTIFPNFVSFVHQTYSDEMELVKDDGRYLEYRFPIYNNYKRIAGYYHIGIDSVFGVSAYTWAISKNGNRHKGYFREIHNGRSDKKRDQTIEEYRWIFDLLLEKIECSPEYKNLDL